MIHSLLWIIIYYFCVRLSTPWNGVGHKWYDSKMREGEKKESRLIYDHW